MAISTGPDSPDVKPFNIVNNMLYLVRSNGRPQQPYALTRIAAVQCVSLSRSTKHRVPSSDIVEKRLREVAGALCYALVGIPLFARSAHATGFSPITSLDQVTILLLIPAAMLLWSTAGLLWDLLRQARRPEWLPQSRLSFWYNNALVEIETDFDDPSSKLLQYKTEIETAMAHAHGAGAIDQTLVSIAPTVVMSSPSGPAEQAAPTVRIGRRLLAALGALAGTIAIVRAIIDFCGISDIC